MLSARLPTFWHATGRTHEHVPTPISSITHAPRVRHAKNGLSDVCMFTVAVIIKYFISELSDIHTQYAPATISLGKNINHLQNALGTFFFV